MTAKRASALLYIHWEAFPEEVPPDVALIDLDWEPGPEHHAYAQQLAAEMAEGKHRPVSRRIWADGCWQELPL